MKKRFKVYYELNDKKLFSIIESDTEEDARNEVLKKIKFIKIEELMTDEEMEVARKAVDTLRESIMLMGKAKEAAKTDLDSYLDLQLEALNKLKEAKEISDSLNDT